MAEKVQVLRVVVASPSDVQAERKALSAVRDELNKGIAKERQVQIELFLWETDTHPGFHPDGPQGHIDGILPIQDCDVFLGVFWKRFGTPTKDARSGTEHEFRLAYKAWQKNRRPQIMVYFNQQAATPKTPEEAIQWSQVLQFQQDFPKEGLWWPYKTKAQFTKLVRDHLTQFLRQQHSLPSKMVPSVEHSVSSASTEEVAILQKEMAEARAKQAAAELMLTRLKKQQEPRTLNKEAFLHALKGRPRARVEILYEDDFEAFRFASQIHEVLGSGNEGDNAGWEVAAPRPISPENTLPSFAANPDAPLIMRAGAQGGLGVVAKAMPKTLREPTAFNALCDAFVEAGIEQLSGGTDHTLSGDLLRIVVGRKVY